MNIDDLTVGQARALAAMFGGVSGEQKPHPFVGQYVIARCSAAGVHAGTVVSVDGDECILSESRRLWRWKAVDGVALSGLAVYGPAPTGCKFDVVLPAISLYGVCELIPVSFGVKGMIDGYK